MLWTVTSLIHSFIHIDHLYSASSRKLLRSAQKPSACRVGVDAPKRHLSTNTFVVFVVWLSQNVSAVWLILVLVCPLSGSVYLSESVYVCLTACLYV